mmetsp:Transcript_2303/g.4706  ORF Transcript_2303/g.4706 Transcript_2303/m.4706 type:complete len:160 (+) Transcript_2303:892-1371(+)
MFPPVPIRIVHDLRPDPSSWDMAAWKRSSSNPTCGGYHFDVGSDDPGQLKVNDVDEAVSAVMHVEASWPTKDVMMSLRMASSTDTVEAGGARRARPQTPILKMLIAPLDITGVFATPFTRCNTYPRLKSSCRRVCGRPLQVLDVGGLRLSGVKVSSFAI